METNKEAIMEEGKRPKTPTRYPKRMAAYVVAFAVQGTFDDPQKIEQMTTNRSIDSTNSTKSSESISPTNSTSTKTFTISPSAKLSSVLNVATISEVKIDIVEESQTGDVTKKKSSQSSSNVVINQETDEQSEIIKSAKNIKVCKQNNKRSRKKPKKSTTRKAQHSVHFIYKKRKNSISRRLEKYLKNAKLNTLNSKQIQTHCNDLSQVVYRSQVLQNVMPKKNSLTDADEQIPSYEDVNFDYDDDSLNSSPSQSKKSFISYTSQKTLVNKESVPSRNDEEYNSPKTANSVIEVTSDKQRYFKSEINNVSLAIKESNTHADQVADSSYSNEKLMHKENLTSSETFLHNNNTELTSKPTSSDEPESFEIDYNELIQKDKSNATITKTVIPDLEKYSEDDSFVNTKLFSDFNKSSIISSCTLQINSCSKENSENVQSNSLINNNFQSDCSKRTTILDRVKSLGFYPRKAPSIDSDPSITCESKNVLFTDNVINSLSFTKDTISCEDHLTDIMKTSVLKKPVEMKNMNYFHNNFVLPNNIAVKAELNARDEIKKSCADNVTNITDMGEVWERVALVLDSAVKRLEETLVERIINNIRESLTIFNQPEYKVTEVHRAATTTVPVNQQRSILTMKNKGIFVKEEHLKLDVDVYVQCDLVQKQVIDQLMFQLSLMPKPIPVSEETFKILKPPELVKDYTEVLKPPAHVTDSFSVEEGKGESVTVSTATTELSSTSSFRILKRLISCPLGVLRENAVILTSVPTFFIVLFCLYGVIVILMKPW